MFIKDIKYLIGVDIGGTWVRVAFSTSDLNTNEIRINTIRTPKDNKYSIINTVILLITEFLVENNIEKDQILGIGLATAGPIDMEKGEVFNNANLGFKEIPLKQPLEERFPKIPIYLINDCNASVLGIHYFEAEPNEKDNLVYITMSTGIGGGVICNGHLILGKEGNAAEVGHGIVEPRSPYQCNCGAYGCWEVYSSGTGVKNRAIEGLENENAPAKILMYMVDNEKSNITAKEIFQAARGGDKFSKMIIEQSIFYSKIGIGLVNNYYDCTSIYFGGSMMNDHKLILPPIIEQFETEPTLFTINHPPKLKVTRYKDDIGVRGALAFLKYKLEGNKVVL
jgi:glucokinase